MLGVRIGRAGRHSTGGRRRCSRSNGDDAELAVAAAVFNPANRTDRVGTVIEASRATSKRRSRLRRRLRRVAGNAAGVRAPCLSARLICSRRDRAVLIGLAVREAGKSLPNAVAEVREAVDFCRYYAQQMRSQFANGGQAEPLGPVVCISPWNFPLAIFIGEVSAALAAGNPVLAKPAEQTPLIAAMAVKLLHEAGIPRAALQLLPGRGETVGARLIGDPRVRGVIFTGSTEVAQLIHRTLAAALAGRARFR